MNEHRLEQLKRMIEQRPGDPFLWHAMGLEYARGGLHPDAIRCYESALATDSGHVGTYFHLGRSQEAINETDQALATYEAGMMVARQVGDFHALAELQQVYELLKEEREQA